MGSSIFVRNTSTNSGSLQCRFRVQGRRPELWDPATGQTGIGIDFRQEPAGGTTLDLPLAAGGSTFVLFPITRSEKPLLRPAAPDSEEPIPGPWTVRFAEGWGAPAETRFDTLQSWTESADEGIRYFSGPAVYQVCDGRCFSQTETFQNIDIERLEKFADLLRQCSAT